MRGGAGRFVSRRSKRPRVRGGCILRMAIVHDEQFVPPNFVHRNQIFDRLLKRLQRLEMFEVTDVLADESLSVDDERDVFFKSAPRARIGRLDGNTATALGAYPRARRRTAGPKTPARAIESSTRRAIGRSPIKKASAMPERRSRASTSSKAIGSLERFALVITRISGAPAANSK